MSLFEKKSLLPKTLTETNLSGHKLVKLYSERRDLLELEKFQELSKPTYDVIIESTEEQAKRLMKLRPKFEGGYLSFQELLAEAELSEVSLVIDLDRGWKVDREQMKNAVELCKRLGRSPCSHPAFSNRYVETSHPQEYVVSRLFDLGSEGPLQYVEEVGRWVDLDFSKLESTKFTNEVLGQPYSPKEKFTMREELQRKRLDRPCGLLDEMMLAEDKECVKLMSEYSTGLANKLLREHFERKQEGPVVKYYPKTEHAHDYIKHTGVCPKCNSRAVLCGECKQCGWSMYANEDSGP